jgi:hypothetical protein
VSKQNTPYKFDDKVHIGFKAQDIKNIYPELVSEDENGYLNVNYVEFVPLLIKSIQELQERIRVLEEAQH